MGQKYSELVRRNKVCVAWLIAVTKILTFGSTPWPAAMYLDYCFSAVHSGLFFFPTFCLPDQG